MPDKPFLFTLHAQTVLKQRELQREWVEQVARAPEWFERGEGGIERRFAAIAESQGRFLRVICVETPTESV